MSDAPSAVDPSMALVVVEPTFRYGEELNPLHLLLSLSDYYGIRPSVEKILEEIDDMRPAKKIAGLSSILTAVRLRNGDTLTKVSERSNISRSQLAFYETGRQKNPGVRTMQALSYGYKIPFSLILLSTMQDIYPRANIRSRGNRDG